MNETIQKYIQQINIYNSMPANLKASVSIQHQLILHFVSLYPLQLTLQLVKILLLALQEMDNFHKLTII
jgi:hypothetical protein